MCTSRSRIRRFPTSPIRGAAARTAVERYCENGLLGVDAVDEVARQRVVADELDRVQADPLVEREQQVGRGAADGDVTLRVDRFDAAVRMHEPLALRVGAVQVHRTEYRLVRIHAPRQ